MTENEITVLYYLLQNEYLNRNGIVGDTKLLDYVKVISLFPESWFTSYNTKLKCDILTYALKNDISAIEAEKTIREKTQITKNQ